MTLPRIATEKEWLAARETLRVEEDRLIETREAVSAARRRLPMVEITKEYTFAGPAGTVGLLELFEGRDQLLIYQFWFEPGEQPCGGCSMWVNNLGRLSYLHDDGTSLAMVSRAPAADLQTIKEERGWTMPWFSVIGDDFNTDTGYVGEAQLTVFVRADDRIFRTYSISGSALTTLSTHWTLLDLTPGGV